MKLKILSFLCVLFFMFSCRNTEVFEGSGKNQIQLAFEQQQNRLAIKREITYFPQWEKSFDFNGNTYIPLMIDKRVSSFTEDGIKYSLDDKIWLQANKVSDDWQFVIVTVLPEDINHMRQSGILLYENWNTGKLSYDGYIENRLLSSAQYERKIKTKASNSKKGSIPVLKCRPILSEVCAGSGNDESCSVRENIVCSTELVSAPIDNTGAGGGGGRGGGTGTGTPPPIIPDNEDKNKEIIDSLQGYPCAQAVLQQLPNLPNTISEWLNRVFAKPLDRNAPPTPVNNIKFFVKFVPSTTLGATTDGAHSGSTGGSSERHTIALNADMLKTASREYIAATMFHEALHAFLASERLRMRRANVEYQFPILYPGWESFTMNGQVRYVNNHSNFSTKFDDLAAAIQSFNPAMTPQEAMALAKGGVVANMSQYEIDVNKNHRDGKTGTTCKP